MLKHMLEPSNAFPNLYDYNIGKALTIQVVYMYND
jgi:hypothetical protein